MVFGRLQCVLRGTVKRVMEIEKEEKNENDTSTDQLVTYERRLFTSHRIIVHHKCLRILPTTTFTSNLIDTYIGF